uniref:uncharacterized protein LOC120337617 isoform X1 n=1 Tax=Styela clava TaxID=7725 RepID=UPI00193A1E2E|nr:uncharacterized protein LOC120337617 isoform X1 [Styela clava]
MKNIAIFLAVAVLVLSQYISSVECRTLMISSPIQDRYSTIPPFYAYILKKRNVENDVNLQTRVKQATKRDQVGLIVSFLPEMHPILVPILCESHTPISLRHHEVNYLKVKVMTRKGLSF